MPFKDLKKNTNELIEHQNGSKCLIHAKFECMGEENNFNNHFEHESQVSFEVSTRNWLTLTLDEGQKGNTHEIKNLQLTIQI